MTLNHAYLASLALIHFCIYLIISQPIYTIVNNIWHMPKQIQNDGKMKTVSVRMPPMLRLRAQRYGINISKLTRVAIIHEIIMTQMRRSQSSDIYAAHPGFYEFINRLILNGFLPCEDLIPNLKNNDAICEIRVTIEYISAGNILTQKMHKFEEPYLDIKKAKS